MKNSRPGKRLVPEHISKGSLSDDDAWLEGFSRNQGMFLVAGAIYRRSMLSKVHTVMFCITNVLLLMCLGRTAFLYKDDLPMLFETLHWFAVSGGVMLAFMQTFNHFRHRYDRIFTIFGKDVYTYSYIDEETSQQMQNLRNQGEQEKLFLVKAFTAMLLGTCTGFSVILPAFNLYTGTFFEPQRSDGIVTGIPCIIWIPAQIADNQIVLVRTVIMLIELYMSTTVIMFVIGQQGTAICIGHKLMYEFKILALAMESFEKRAKWAYEQECGSEQMRPSSRKMKKYLKKSMEEAVIHHHILIDAADDYKRIFYLQELALLLSNTMLICLSSISLVSDMPLEAKAVMLIFTGSELGNVFVICYYGQVLLDGHNIVGNGLYNSNWTKHSAVIGKYVLIIQCRLQKPLSLSAGGFTDISLDTYAQVVKSSFSYFSLLQALQS